MVRHRHPSFRSSVQQVRSLPVRVQTRSRPVRWATPVPFGQHGDSCPLLRTPANSRMSAGRSSMHCRRPRLATWRVHPLRACSRSRRWRDWRPVWTGRWLQVGTRVCRERLVLRTRLRVGRRSSFRWLRRRRFPGCRWMSRSRALRWAAVRSRCCLPVRMRESSWARSRESSSLRRGPWVGMQSCSRHRGWPVPCWRPPISVPPNSRSSGRPHSRRASAPGRHPTMHLTRGHPSAPKRIPFLPQWIRPRREVMRARSTPPRSPPAAVAERSAACLRREVSERLSRRAGCGRWPRLGVRQPRPSQPVQRYPAPDSSRRSGRTRTPLAQAELWNSTASLMGATGRSPSIARAGPIAGGAAALLRRTKSLQTRDEPSKC